jgi:exodeoxyribonuclease VII small subunit
MTARAFSSSLQIDLEHVVDQKTASHFSATCSNTTYMSTNDTPHADIAALPFEEAMRQLEQIVQRLERGDVPLEESISIYERGNQLRKQCETLLKQAELKVEVITQGADGKANGTRPLDVE